MTLASIIAAWAVLWVLVAAAVMATGRRRGWPLPATAAWLVTIGAFLAAQEDPLLLIQMASTRPSTTGFRDGVLGLVHVHTRGHIYSAAILALAGLGLAVVVAHAPLVPLGEAPSDRRRQRPPRPGCLIPCHPVSPVALPGGTQRCSYYTSYYSARHTRGLLPRRERALTCGN